MPQTRRACTDCTDTVVYEDENWCVHTLAAEANRLAKTGFWIADDGQAQRLHDVDTLMTRLMTARENDRADIARAGLRREYPQDGHGSHAAEGDESD